MYRSENVGNSGYGLENVWVQIREWIQIRAWVQTVYIHNIFTSIKFYARLCHDWYDSNSCADDMVRISRGNCFEKGQLPSNMTNIVCHFYVLSRFII